MTSPHRIAIGLLVVCSPVAVVLAEDPAPGKQVEQALVLPGETEPAIEYQLFLPEKYGETDEKWPLILFLHGRGESYGPLSLVKKWGPPRLVEREPAAFPFVVVSPQCPARPANWSDETRQKQLVQLLDDIVERYDVDPDRVYLTGLSMGGYGSWTLAASHPERFAAVAPICGGGNPANAGKLVNLPIWVFHGDKDNAVPIRRSQEMVAAIRKAGGERVRFTTLEELGHNSWSAAYATPDLYSWMQRHTASGNAKSDDR